MIFRPRIFISSTFSENKELREKMRNYFTETGAEPLLYEHELTPSTIPMTYRENIKDADFVILIMKDNYGTKTDWDISGTHEEYLIARNNGIPIHVYLKKPTPDTPPANNPLFDDLKKDGVSHYYFDNDDELLKRMQETTFTIAKEIMLNQIVKNNLPLSTIKKLAGNSDYSQAMEIIQIIESMLLIHMKYELDFIDTTIFTVCTSPVEYEVKRQRYFFLNWKLNDLLTDMLEAADAFTNGHTKDYTSIPGSHRDYPIAVLGTICVSRVNYWKNTKLSHDDYVTLLQQFFDKYAIFKSCVQELRTETDL